MAAGGFWATVGPFLGRLVSRRVWGRVAAWSAGLVVAVAITSTVAPGTASAHAFLVSSDPSQGARLAQPPSVLVLRFTERVVAAATSVTVRVIGRSQPLPTDVSTGGDAYTIRAALSESPAGIYEVSWQTVSADDGHASTGEFAFAAGRVSGVVPPAAETTPGASQTVGVVATVLFLLGLAAGLGGALTALAVDGAAPGRKAGVAAGLLTATVGAGISLLNDLSRAHGTPSHAATLTAVALGLVAAAMFCDARIRRPEPVLVALLAAGATWAGLSHPAIIGGAAGLAVNAVHLVAGTAWIGTLGYLLVAVIAHRHDREKLRASASCYSRVALSLVVILAAAGSVSALEVLPSWSSLYASRYGQLILVKTGLFVVAVGLAAVGQTWGLRRGGTAILSRSVPLEAVAVTAVLVVTAALANSAPPVKAQPLSAIIGPPPITGPVTRSAGLAGQLTIGIVAGSGQLEVDLTAPDRSPLSAHIDIDAYTPNGDDIGLFPRPCGPGCFSEHYTLPAGITRLVVSAHASRWAGGNLTTSLAWPPAAANPQLLQKVIAVMDAQPRVATTETVTSNTDGRSFTTTLPPTSGRQLMALQPYGNGGDDAAGSAPVTDVRPLPFGGPGLQLYLAGEPAWVTIWLDPQHRIARQQIVSVGHLITDTYQYR